MSYIALILIDNSSILTSANIESDKATVKYFMSNINEDNKVAIAVTDKTAQYHTEYDNSINT